MLCSLPNAKSSSTWLDRLHTLKGFNDPAPSNPNPEPPDPLPQNSNPDSQVRPFDVMSSILADLFVMDPPDSVPTQTLLLKPGAKRGLRKQPTPKICILTNTIPDFPPNYPPSTSAAVADLMTHKRNSKLKVVNKSHQVKEEKKKKKNREKKRIETGSGSNALATGSKAGSGTKGRTEATVIDTSTPGWKSAKILIRKGSIWKVVASIFRIQIQLVLNFASI